MRSIHVMIALVLCFSMAASAHAVTSIGVNFVGGRPNNGQDGSGGTSGSLLGAGESAGVVAQTNWNNAFGNNGGPQALNDNSGAATGAAVTWGGVPNTWTITGGTQTTGDAKLMNGYLDTNASSTTTVTVTNVPYSVYDVILYYDGDGNNLRSGSYSINGNVFSPAVDSQPNFPNNGGLANYDDATGDLIGNYLVIRQLSGNVNASAMAVNFRGPLNAIQIIAMPEPATAMLGVMGVAGLVLRRRKLA